MVGTVRKYLKDSPAVDDVVQDAMLAAFLHRDSFKGRSRRSTWLYRIAANAALMHLRNTRRRSMYFDTEAAVEDLKLVTGRSPEHEAGVKEELAHATKKIHQLGKRYIKVVKLHALGFTDCEISKRTQLKMSTVKTRFYRARQKLR